MQPIEFLTAEGVYQTLPVDANSYIPEIPATAADDYLPDVPPVPPIGVTVPGSEGIPGAIPAGIPGSGGRHKNPCGGWNRVKADDDKTCLGHECTPHDCCEGERRDDLFPGVSRGPPLPSSMTGTGTQHKTLLLL